MILKHIEAHLRRHRMSPTRFGREAVGDPNLVSQLRDGRELREKTMRRLRAYLDAREVHS